MNTTHNPEAFTAEEIGNFQMRPGPDAFPRAQDAARGMGIEVYPPGVQADEIKVEMPQPPPSQKAGEIKSMVAIKADQLGLLKPANIDEAFRMAKAYYASKLLPARFNTPEMIMTAVQFVLELGLKPLTALRQLAVIKGTPSLFGDLPLSLCYASGQVESIKEWWIDKDGVQICSQNKNLAAEAWGAVTVVKRRGDIEPLERFFTLDDARAACLLPASPPAPWACYPKVMLKFRARSQALKDKFPDALNGIAIAEYDFNSLPDENHGSTQEPKDVTPPPASGKAAALREKLDGAQ